MRGFTTGHKGTATISYVRCRYDAIEVGIPDAPRRGEMVLALVTMKGAPHPCPRWRSLGADVKHEDGLR